MARQVLENGVILPAEYSDDWYDDMTSNLTKLDDVIGSDSEKLSSADVGAAALSNNYNDLDNLPTIPTVNDATLTIQKNGVDVQTFTANASSNVTCNITVPSKTSDLTNDSNFVDTSNPAVASGITSAKVTDYDTHIADTDIHVTASDKTIWNAVTSKANDSDVVHKSGDETVGGTKTFSDLQIIGYGTQYKGSRNAYILPEFAAGYSGLSITTLGFSQNLKIGNFVLDANNKPSLDTSKSYIQIATGENNGVNACILEPRNSTSSSLGTSANKWSKIYGTEYYYGSNNIEFSTKFVTTDTNQTISGNKTFSKYITSDGSSTGDEYSPNTRTNLWLMGNRDTEEVSGILFDSYRQNTAQGTGIHILGIGIKENSVRYEGCRFGWYWENDLNGYSFDFNPTTQGANQALKHNLGTSRDKWDTINGVEPSSLSLPDLSNGIDISSYITDLTGSPNIYISPANGYIILRSTTANVLGIIENTTGMGTFSRGSNQVLAVYLPVVKNSSISIYTICSSLTHAKFIPCLGNV